jgi:hypothetical protein
VAASKRKQTGAPRKDLAASRAVARHKATGEPLAACAKAEGISAQTAYNELNRLELVAALPPTPASRLGPSSAPHGASAEAEPTDEEIANIDTLEVGRSIMLTLWRRYKADKNDDAVNKILAAIQRIEQIERSRPRVTPPDEVTRRLVEVRERAEERILAIVVEKEAKLAADMEAFATWAREAFGELGGAEAVRRLKALLGVT